MKYMQKKFASPSKNTGEKEKKGKLIAKLFCVTRKHNNYSNEILRKKEKSSDTEICRSERQT